MFAERDSQMMLYMIVTFNTQKFNLIIRKIKCWSTTFIYGADAVALSSEFFFI